jgi:hypothetical protein
VLAGDNAIMEQKIVLDTVLGKTPRFPSELWQVAAKHPMLLVQYLKSTVQAAIMAVLAKVSKAQPEQQVLRDIAWTKAHVLVLARWYRALASNPSIGNSSFSASYARVLLRWPVPTLF